MLPAKGDEEKGILAIYRGRPIPGAEEADDIWDPFHPEGRGK